MIDYINKKYINTYIFENKKQKYNLEIFSSS